MDDTRWTADLRENRRTMSDRMTAEQVRIHNERVKAEADRARQKREKDPCLTKFIGAGGYPDERTAAAKVFVVGKEYRCIGGSMGQSHTHIEIEGVPGGWNSVLFDIDVHHCPAIQNMMISRKRDSIYPWGFGPIEKCACVNSDPCICAAQRGITHILCACYCHRRPTEIAPEPLSCPPEPKEAVPAQAGVFFVIPGNPIGKPRMTRADSWKKRPAVLRYRAWCDAARPNVLQLPEKPVSLSFVTYIGFPASCSAKRKALYSGKPHQQKFDIDNIAKSLMDLLLKDDSVIAILHAEKYWDDGKGPRIEITIK